MNNTIFKKKWGQHLLTNEITAQKIVSGFLAASKSCDVILEVGPGRGSLTKYLLKQSDKPVYMLEIDPSMAGFIQSRLNVEDKYLIRQDFLTFEPADFFKELKVGLIGNFPYNISGPIFFKILENRHIFSVTSGMFQKEVSRRLTALPGSKVYGMTSVLASAYFEHRYLMSVPPSSFNPPPKVQSGVVELISKAPDKTPEDEKTFIALVKRAFNQRRKKLRNTLEFDKSKELPELLTHYPDLRPEQLSYTAFEELMPFLIKN